MSNELTCKTCGKEVGTNAMLINHIFEKHHPEVRPIREDPETPMQVIPPDPMLKALDILEKQMNHAQTHASQMEALLLEKTLLMKMFVDGNMKQSKDKPWEDPKLRELMADLCHQQWSGWMKYMFSKGYGNLDNGTWMMPKEFVIRWERQMTTHYKKLSAEEQDSDREEADKFLGLLKTWSLNRDVVS